MAGSYVNPGWTNASAPALDQTNLGNMSEAIVENQKAIQSLQTLTADYTQNMQQLNNNTQQIASLKGHLLIVTNGSIPATAWAADTTYSDSGYQYRAKIAVSAVTDQFASIVNFSPTDSVSGNFSPVSICTSGGVYVYAKTAPVVATPVPSVICIQQTV